MSTDIMHEIKTSSSDATYAIGERLGSLSKGGECFVLSSDLGGGKTTFTKGLAKGLGISGPVTSPTFTVNRTYQGDSGLTLSHFDFYRLDDPGVVGHELAEVEADPLMVTVIEWANIVRDVLPEDCIHIQIDRTADGEDERIIRMQVPTQRAYLLEGLE